jgi:hypothetical protein
MTLTLENLISEVRSHSSEPLARLDAAVEVAEKLAATGDSLVTQFVDESRAAGFVWSEIAPHLSRDREAPASRPPAASMKTQLPVVHEHTGKYRPLWEWLNKQQDYQVKTTFSEIEHVLGFSLPRSSHVHLPHWYGYKGSAVARAIIDAGWRAHNVDLKAETLTLTRTRVDAT